MRQLLCIATFLVISGCVTQNVYEGSKHAVMEKKIDKTQAARTRISLALKYLSMGDSAQAKFNLEKAVKFAPKLPEVHYSYAYYYQKVDEDELAKNAYKRALSIAPNDPDTLNNYGAFLCDIGEFDLAVDNFLHAIEVPSYLRVAETYENLALCAIKTDDFEHVEGYLKSSVKHSPKRGSSLINLSAFYYAKSDLHKAQQTLKRYGATGRTSSRSLLLSYLIEMNMGHIETARILSQTIEQTYTTSTEARMLRQNKISSSEFERLKEQYRKSELRKLQKDILSHKGKPKIKIIKRKKPLTVTKNNKSEESAEKAKSEPNEQSAVIVSKNNKAAGLEESAVAEKAKSESLTNKSEQVSSVVNKQLTHSGAPFHIIATGETLYGISTKYNVKMQDLLQYNGISETDKINKGTKIFLNNPIIFHWVTNGDNLFSISVKYNILMKRLIEWNKLEGSALLTPNRKILLVDPKKYIL